MSRSSQLLELQLIDTQLDNNQKRLREIAKILSDNKEIEAAEKQVTIAAEVLETSTKFLREAESLVQDQRLKIKQTDTKLYSGKINNPKELQDLQNESEALRRYLSILEDRQLESMLEVDEKKEVLIQIEAIFARILENANIIKDELSSEKTEINRENNNLEDRRITTVKSIPRDDLSIYEKLRKQRFGVAVSKVSEGACSSCGATLTAALAQLARSPSQITFCETCGRILCDQ